jgi:hypothetical protein
VDPDGVPWVYNDAAYQFTNGGTTVCFAVTPAAKDVRLRIDVNGELVYEFQALGVEDVRLQNDRSGDSLLIVILGSHVINLQLKPRICASEIK